MIKVENFIFTKKLKQSTLSVSAIGLLLFFISCFIYHDTPARIWSSILVNNVYFLGISLCGFVFIAIHRLANAGWYSLIQRIPEAFISFLPISGLIFIILLFGSGSLFHWTHVDPSDTILEGKSIWLNLPFFSVRMLLYLGGWIILAMQLKKISLKEDLTGELRYYKHAKTISAIFLVFFAVTISVFSWDWIMSIEPHWYSTLFGWYFFSGLLVTGIAGITIVVVYLHKQGYLIGLNENHFHDLGKFLFGFSIFWTYLWYSQYVLIWYGNIPEETIYYANRASKYPILFWSNLIINFFIPFLALMTVHAKKNTHTLLWVSLIILAGHWLDFYLLIVPGLFENSTNIGVIEIGTTLFFSGIFIYIIFSSLSKVPLVPKNHPFLEESLHYDS